ncbi:YlzJ-like family protein [Fredinandcohnia humi]
MILYTMMPQEFIFPQAEIENNQSKIIEINGVSLSVCQTNGGEYVIERVLSTNPFDYLDNRFTPGQRIKM